MFLIRISVYIIIMYSVHLMSVMRTSIFIIIMYSLHFMSVIRTSVYCRSGNFRVFQFSRISDFGLFTKFRIREFSFFFSSAIIIKNFAGFLNSRICLRREIREN